MAHRKAPRVARHVDIDGGDAFVPDYRRGFVECVDGDAEAFGEEFVTAATSAESVAEDARDEPLDEEIDGYVIETSESPIEESTEV